MKKPLFSLALLLLAASPAFPSEYSEVFFADREQTVREGDTLTVTARLSPAAFVRVEAPFYIDAASSAALQTGETGGDFQITTQSAEENGFIWDTAARRGRFIFAPGETEKSFTINITDDNTAEMTETILLRIDSENVTVARPVASQSLLIYIEDGDTPPAARFRRALHEVNEGESLRLEVELSSPAPGSDTLEIVFAIRFGSASEDDLLAPEPLSLIIPSGETSGALYIGTKADMEAEQERETFFLTMEPPPGGEYTADEREAECFIADNDPAFASFQWEGEGPPELAAQEYETVKLTAELSGPVNEKVILPLTFGGSAAKGESAETEGADYHSSAETIEIPAGATSASVTLIIHNDTAEENEESITVHLEDPNLPGLALGEHSSYTIRIADNDPVELNFGILNKAYDPETDNGEPAYLPASALTAAETDGNIDFYVFLSSKIDGTAAFDLAVEGNGATLYDPDAEDQAWDFYIQDTTAAYAGELQSAAPPVRFWGTDRSFIFRIALNNDSLTDDEETITLRLSNLNTEESGIVPGQYQEAIITIKERPDLDITSHLEAAAPDGFDYNPVTGLHEALFSFIPSPGLLPEDCAGYRSYKIVFRGLESPFALRYPAGFKQETRPETNEEEYFPYVLHPINLPALDPDREEERAGFPEWDNPADLRIEFANGGRKDFPQAIIDSLAAEGGIQIFLSREDLPAAEDSYNRAEIASLHQGPDASIRLDIHNPHNEKAGRYHYLQIQYLDSGGFWRVAQPALITGAGSQLNWVDRGPPKTHAHPADAGFRLYRVLLK